MYSVIWLTLIIIICGDYFLFGTLLINNKQRIKQEIIPLNNISLMLINKVFVYNVCAYGIIL